MKNVIISVSVLLIKATLLSACGAQSTETIDLSGTWAFQLDPNNTGVERQLYNRQFEATIHLPGSVDIAGLGAPQPPQLYRLTRTSAYVGQAWYQRQVTIPNTWQDRKITLILERCHWQTTVWINDHKIGSRNSLVAPHRYNLTDYLAPGEHTLTICVDNRHIIDVGQWSASVTDESQTNWNGIVGTIALESQPAISIASLQIHPDYHSKTIRADVTVDNTLQSSQNGDLLFKVYSKNPKNNYAVEVRKPDIILRQGRQLLTFELPLGEDVPSWSEFDPHILQCDVTLTVLKDTHKHTASIHQTFGLRSVSIDHTKFLVNGRKIFLRGTVDAAQFPIAGHPPMDKADWISFFENYRRYGLNHVRFHSWCPPTAAFEAADKLGFYLQVEAPFWLPAEQIQNSPTQKAFMRAEVSRMLAEYGNHPSFMFLSFGNELAPDGQPFFEELVQKVKAKDRRRLCAASMRFELHGADDFYHTVLVGDDYVRGQGRIGLTPFDSIHDYENPLRSVDRPILVHEAGQYTMYPDFNEIDLYTGVLRPKNFIAYRQSLKENGMLEMAETFKQASGRLMLALYKEEMEAALRSPSMGGIQLLGMTDFHGWGTAVIGPLNALHKNKGLISEAAFREFCNDTVVLLRIDKPVWQDTEHFIAAAEIAHWGHNLLAQKPLNWSLRDKNGTEVLSGQLDPQNITPGGNTRFGNLSFNLADLKTPGQFELVLNIDNTAYRNRWYIWVYPAIDRVTVPETVHKVSAWDEETKTLLNSGKDVFMVLDGNCNYRNIQAIRYAPPFWSAGLFANQPATHGIVCRPRHPALAHFPTDHHSNWQWFDLLHNAHAMILNELPQDYRPIVQPIDNFYRNNRLGTLFQIRAGSGRLLVSTMNTETAIDRESLACRQLLHSLLEYMQSDTFEPTHKLSFEQLDSLFETRQKQPATEAPPIESNAVRLRVTAAAALEDIIEKTWSRKHDRIDIKKPGFDYSIQANSFKHYAVSNWKARRLGITVKTPKGFTGALYVLFSDWDSRGRSQALFYEGQDFGPLDVNASEGFWKQFDVTEQDTQDGQIVIEARTVSGPDTLVAELLLIEQ